MALEAFLDSNSYSQMPIILNGSGGIMEALTSQSSLQNEDDLHSMLSMAQLNANFGSDFINSRFLENSSTSRSAIGIPTGAHLQFLGNTNMEPYISKPSYPTPFPSYNPADALYSDDTISRLFHTGEKVSKKRHSGPDIYKTKVQTRQNSVPTVKKPRIDVNQENIQQEIIQELVLKELRECNPQLKEMIEQYRRQLQLSGFHMQIPKQLVKTQNRSLLQGHDNRQEISAPLFDGGICSRRFKQYLFHLRNNRHDNSISYWKKFVSEYYAPGSKKRWCFCKYENIELHTAGVFCPQSMETWCCQLCGSKSGKGLEATLEQFPRLFKIKYESGMLDEILFLDSPRTCKVACGVLLEYGKVIQESVYDTFRVVHKGKLRIIFRPDLKILSWEFCIENHDEFLQRTLFTPQVNQLVQAAEKYQGIQSCASSRESSQGLRKVCNMFVSAGTQILRNMELPLVNDLGYPKRFIRCLQIGEVVDSMRDLMVISCNTEMGPIECLNNYSRGSKTDNHMNTKQENELFAGFHASSSWTSQNSVISGLGNPGLAFINSNHRFCGPNSSIPCNRELESCITGHPDQAMSSFSSILHNEAARQSDRSYGTSREVPYGESSNGSNFSKAGDVTAVSRRVTVKEEPYSPERLSEAFLSSSAGITEIQDFPW